MAWSSGVASGLLTLRSRCRSSANMSLVLADVSRAPCADVLDTMCARYLARCGWWSWLTRKPTLPIDHHELQSPTSSECSSSGDPPAFFKVSPLQCRCHNREITGPPNVLLAAFTELGRRMETCATCCMPHYERRRTSPRPTETTLHRYNAQAR